MSRKRNPPNPLATYFAHTTEGRILVLAATSVQLAIAQVEKVTEVRNAWTGESTPKSTPEGVQSIQSVPLVTK